jgi:hypothetical protein
VNKLFLFIIFFGLFVFSLSCKDEAYKLLPQNYGKVNSNTENIESIVLNHCTIESVYQGGNHGFGFSFNINPKKELTRIFEFPDFDSLQYQNNLPVKALNTRNKSFQYLFEYDTKGLIKAMRFEGKDGTGKTFNYQTNYTANSKNQIEKVELALATYPVPLKANIVYDAKGNILKIISTTFGKEVILIENVAFDDKINPFANYKMDKFMMYFIVYTASTGGNNLSLFVNKNNILKSKIRNIDGSYIELSYKYSYSKDGLPIKASISTLEGGSITNSENTFAYFCK